jgi:hypothetical protein
VQTQLLVGGTQAPELVGHEAGQGIPPGQNITFPQGATAVFNIQYGGEGGMGGDIPYLPQMNVGEWVQWIERRINAAQGSWNQLNTEGINYQQRFVGLLNNIRQIPPETDIMSLSILQGGNDPRHTVIVELTTSIMRGSLMPNRQGAMRSTIEAMEVQAAKGRVGTYTDIPSNTLQRAGMTHTGIVAGIEQFGREKLGKQFETEVTVGEGTRRRLDLAWVPMTDERMIGIEVSSGAVGQRKAQQIFQYYEDLMNKFERIHERLPTVAELENMNELKFLVASPGTKQTWLASIREKIEGLMTVGKRLLGEDPSEQQQQRYRLMFGGDGEEGIISPSSFRVFDLRPFMREKHARLAEASSPQEVQDMFFEWITEPRNRSYYNQLYAGMNPPGSVADWRNAGGSIIDAVKRWVAGQQIEEPEGGFAEETDVDRQRSVTAVQKIGQIFRRKRYRVGSVAGRITRFMQVNEEQLMESFRAGEYRTFSLVERLERLIRLAEIEAVGDQPAETGTDQEVLEDQDAAGTNLRNLTLAEASALAREYGETGLGLVAAGGNRAFETMIQQRRHERRTRERREISELIKLNPMGYSTELQNFMLRGLQEEQEGLDLVNEGPSEFMTSPLRRGMTSLDLPEAEVSNIFSSFYESLVKGEGKDRSRVGMAIAAKFTRPLLEIEKFFKSYEESEGAGAGEDLGKLIEEASTPEQFGDLSRTLERIGEDRAAAVGRYKVREGVDFDELVEKLRVKLFDTDTLEYGESEEGEEVPIGIKKGTGYSQKMMDYIKRIDEYYLKITPGTHVAVWRYGTLG